MLISPVGAAGTGHGPKVLPSSRYSMPKRSQKVALDCLNIVLFHAEEMDLAHGQYVTNIRGGWHWANLPRRLRLLLLHTALALTS